MWSDGETGEKEKRVGETMIVTATLNCNVTQLNDSYFTSEM